MNVNSLESQLCLDFFRYFSGAQARLYGRGYLKAQKILCYFLSGPNVKNALRNLLFPHYLTFEQRNLCVHKGGWYELA